MVTRGGIVESAREYFRGLGEKEFKPGESYITPSGAVLDENDLAALIDTSLSMWLTSGPMANKFQLALAEKVGSQWACMTNSGSSANLLAFSALDLKPGDEVITVACGFPTTVAPIVQRGCVPVFVDVDLDTANINVNLLEQALTPKTRAIMIAHSLGNPFNLKVVSEFAAFNQLLLVEDCCDALGSTYQGCHVGSWGDLATLSFYPAHQITMGEGGAVFGDSRLFKKRVESYRDWGRDCWCETGHDNTCGRRFDWKLGDLPEGYDHKYTYRYLGYNLKATDLQAAVGLSQLAKVDKFVHKRRSNHQWLKQACLDLGLDEYFILPEATLGSAPSWFGFLLTIKEGLERRKVISFLEHNKIGTRLLFGGNLTKQPAFKGVNYKIASSLENTDKIMNDSFWIGCWPGIGEKQLEYMKDVLGRIKEMA